MLFVPENIHEILWTCWTRTSGVDSSNLSENSCTSEDPWGSWVAVLIADEMRFLGEISSIPIPYLCTIKHFRFSLCTLLNFTCIYFIILTISCVKNRKSSCLRLKSMEIKIPLLLVKISIFIAILTWTSYKTLKKQEFFCHWIEKNWFSEFKVDK